MRVSQILPVIQGENPTAGLPMLLIRLAGCPLRCSFCDTRYALDLNSGTEMSIKQIHSKIKKYSPEWILLSGGEPLMQEKELGELLMTIPIRADIEIQTSGFYSPPTWHFSALWTVDYKCPSSDAESKNIEKWLDVLSRQDNIKFVVGTEEDLEFVRTRRLYTEAQILVSPVIWDIKDYLGQVVIGKEQAEWMRRVAEFCMGTGYRLSLQTHRIIWGERNDV